MTQHGQDTALPGFSSETDTVSRLVQGLRARRLPQEQVDDLRAEIRRMLGLIGRVPESPAARRAVATAQWWLVVRPRKLEWPSHLFIGGLEAVLRELRRYCPSTPAVDTLAPAAAYTCLTERGDLRAVQAQLQGAAAVYGGRVDYYHHDTGLGDWAIADRPGWLRVERLVLARCIEVLVMVSLDELIPTPGIRLPSEMRKAAQEDLRQMCLSRGIRLVCVDGLVRAAGATR